MKIEQREQIVKNYKTVYIADDGTVFSSQEECEQYEKTARAVIDGRFCKAFDYDLHSSNKDVFNDCLYHFGGCGDDYWLTVTPKNQEEIDIINMFLRKYCNNSVLDSSYIGKNVILTGYDGEYYLVGDEAQFRKEIEWSIQRILTGTIPMCKECKYYCEENEKTKKCLKYPRRYVGGTGCPDYEEREVK